MKIKFLFLATLLLFIGCRNGTNNSNKKIVSKETEKVVNQLRHVVLFKFKESSTSTDIQRIEVAFDDLHLKISEIKDFEWGINNSPEKLNKGFTHCFFLTFDSEKDRDTYLSHAAHLAFGNELSPHLEDVLVVDYWIK